MEKIGLSEALLIWYNQVHRKLPWRVTHDPYRIWVSEVMLQQTQVITVIDYYNRFIAAFPTVFDLAAAEEDQVFKLWEGLGYYSRARNLMRCAKIVSTEYKGHFPNDLKAVLKLPGIGPYTAGAVLSIAYNKKVPAVDGNVMRVISRLFECEADVSQSKSRLVFEGLVEEILPEDCRHFNQALMELGATVCTPRSPKCSECPIQGFCQSEKQQTQDQFPIKSKKIQQTHHHMALAYIVSGDKILLVKRHEDGLLSGLWGLPLWEHPEGFLETSEGQNTFVEHMEEQFNIALNYAGSVATAKHVFTHRVWHMTLHQLTSSQLSAIEFPQIVYVTSDELKDYALSTAYHKVLSKLK